MANVPGDIRLAIKDARFAAEAIRPASSFPVQAGAPAPGPAMIPVFQILSFPMAFFGLPAVGAGGTGAGAVAPTNTPTSTP